MGNSYFRQNSQMLASQDPKQFLQNDIPRFIISDLISRGKFIKTFHGKIDGNNVIVKVYFRNCDDDLSDIAKKLTLISKKLSPAKYPCLLPYQIWLKSNNKITRTNTSPTYLIRQYFFHNLYERLSTRPFLHDIEKRFIIFQLMKVNLNTINHSIQLH
jgi:phosphoinositide-3-kinase regulatory subunit 4